MGNSARHSRPLQRLQSMRGDPEGSFLLITNENAKVCRRQALASWAGNLVNWVTCISKIWKMALSYEVTVFFPCRFLRSTHSRHL